MVGGAGGVVEAVVVEEAGEVMVGLGVVVVKGKYSQH